MVIRKDPLTGYTYRDDEPFIFDAPTTGNHPADFDYGIQVEIISLEFSSPILNYWMRPKDNLRFDRVAHASTLSWYVNTKPGNCNHYMDWALSG
jgi:hypothetical protein